VAQSEAKTTPPVITTPQTENPVLHPPPSQWRGRVLPLASHLPHLSAITHNSN